MYGRFDSSPLEMLSFFLFVAAIMENKYSFGMVTAKSCRLNDASTAPRNVGSHFFRFFVQLVILPNLHIAQADISRLAGGQSGKCSPSTAHWSTRALFCHSFL